MRHKNIYERLCYYDERNPFYDAEHAETMAESRRRDGCSCDNCFYGRTELAQEIIDLREELELAEWYDAEGGV